MTNLNLTRSEVRHRVELINNSTWNHHSDTFHPTPDDLDRATTFCCELLERVRAETTERYRQLRLRAERRRLQSPEDREPFKVFDGGRTTSVLDLTEQLEIRIVQIARTFLADLDPEGVNAGLQLNDLEELERFYPEVAEDMDLVTLSYKDWSLCKYSVKTIRLQSYGQFWGVRIVGNNAKYAAEIGKAYSVDYLSKSEWQKIEAKQRELAEHYVETTLAAYRHRHKVNTDHLPKDHPQVLETLELYKRAFTDKDFAGLITFTHGGTGRSANGAKYSAGPRNWKNEYYDRWEKIAASEHLEYYHYAPADLLRTMNIPFEEGDIEALYRFCMELEKPPQPAPAKTAKKVPIKDQLLTELLQRTPGQETNKQVASLVPMLKGGERSSDDVDKRRGDFLSGSKTFAKATIDQIINELKGKGIEVKDGMLLRQVRQYAT